MPPEVAGVRNPGTVHINPSPAELVELAIARGEAKLSSDGALVAVDAGLSDRTQPLCSGLGSERLECQGARPHVGGRPHRLHRRLACDVGGDPRVFAGRVVFTTSGDSVARSVTGSGVVGTAAVLRFSQDVYTVAEGGGDNGNVDHPQYVWLRGELRRATRRGQLVVAFGHHTLGTMNNARTDELAGACQPAENATRPSRRPRATGSKGWRCPVPLNQPAQRRFKMIGIESIRDDIR